MSITVTPTTPELTGNGPYPCGIQWTGNDSITRRAVMTTMIHQSMQIAVGWQVENQVPDLSGNLKWESAASISSPALIVNNDHYRFIGDATLRIADATEALNEDGTVKPGYISEYMFFVGAFGTHTIAVPFGIYAFIQDALVRKLNAENPGLDLVMPV